MGDTIKRLLNALEDAKEAQEHAKGRSLVEQARAGWLASTSNGEIEEYYESRKHIATALMAANIAASNGIFDSQSEARSAVVMADTLLDELYKTRSRDADNVKKERLDKSKTCE